MSAQDIVALNRLAVGATGEPHFLRDGGLLESAAHRPEHMWSYGGKRDLTNLAVALLFAVCQNHPFQQGNKRTGFLAFDFFLKLNGFRLDAADAEDLAQVMLDVISGEAPESRFADRVRGRIVPYP